MIERHLMKLRARDEINDEEEAAIRGSVAEIRRIAADQVVVRALQPMDFSTILLSGIAGRAKDLADGKRQITELHTPGDYTDLHSFTLKYLDHDVLALSDCEFAVVPHEKLREITQRLPHLTRVYWFATNLDAAVHREWEVCLGRRSAVERMAHLFCELHVRMGLVGLVEDDGYELSLTQSQLAECLGLTQVHVNRTLMELRNGLLEFSRGRVRIRNLAALRALAGFDPAYLYLDRRPR
ncbi:Crp/Fnr family transcriptional regulator [Phenylobacterium sp.]|jgi:CRP-like cAMP-binding protein|uniref:Crp/Fnr family transcriptional regulator n=1 Tax=Phenylobacterium sp. TaxID=1871053 RepID=UPI002E367974|nr:Crp/Fnr family transcriptional regulator [Phenylobacterium sp.]HEX2560353.1 Crp/Fnr family transcriptional regulator [Phenylobacterium sp.]